MKLIENTQRYYITEDGKVLSKQKDGSYKELSAYIGRGGYKRISLVGVNGKFNKYVHRLVAEAFIDNPDNKPTVNHKDSDRLNNNSSNLEWCTYSENNKHAYDFGKQKKFVGEEHKDSLLSNKEVLEIWDAMLSGHRRVDVCKKYGISSGIVGNIINRNSYSSITELLPDIPYKKNKSKLSYDTVLWICKMLYSGVSYKNILTSSTNDNISYNVVRDINQRKSYINIINQFLKDEGSTTIPNGSTLQAIGRGNSENPFKD